MTEQCVVLAESPSALVKLCGITILERLLRTLQRCGVKEAIVLSSTPESIRQELAGPSWARAGLDLTFRVRPAGSPVAMEEILDLWPNGLELLLIIPANSVWDPRLLRILIANSDSAALVDSAVPAQLSSLVTSAPSTKRGQLCGPALLGRPWARSRTGSLPEALRTGLEDQTLSALDVDAEPLYHAPLNRKLRAYWFPAPGRDGAKLAKRVLLDSAQKGTLDFPAIVHGPIETFFVSYLCETSITPNQLTILTNIAAWSATILLASGRLGWGLALAVIVGVLDGLDGKQARVKIETTRHGKLEHWFDAFFEISWWFALAFHFHQSGQVPGAFRYLALLLVAQALDGILKSGVRFAAGKSIEELGTLERVVHLIGGRRNVMVWMLAIGYLFGAAAKIFMIMPWLVLATAILHLPRAIWVFCQLRKRSKEGARPKETGTTGEAVIP
jgi:phosphatidylglycerophosphate synthase